MEIINVKKYNKFIWKRGSFQIISTLNYSIRRISDKILTTWEKKKHKNLNAQIFSYNKFKNWLYKYK